MNFRYSSLSFVSLNRGRVRVTQWRRNYFWAGGGGEQNRGRRNRVCQKKVFTGFGPLYCPRNMRSL